MPEDLIAIANDWAVAADNLQWVLLRRHSRKMGDTWDAVSFVRSERDILARCMREKGIEPGTAVLLLSGLPNTFDEWKAFHRDPDIAFG